jgi:hypothetical protein
LAVAFNDGKPVWSPTDHLLADLWVLQVRASSEKGSLPDEFDHPDRAAVTAKQRLKSKMATKAKYMERKRRRAKPVEGVTD